MTPTEHVFSLSPDYVRHPCPSVRQPGCCVLDRPTVQCGDGDGVVGGAAVSDLSFGDHPPCRLLGKGRAEKERVSSISLSLSFFLSSLTNNLFLFSPVSPPRRRRKQCWFTRRPFRAAQRASSRSRNLTREGAARPEILALTLVACSFLPSYSGLFW